MRDAKTTSDGALGMSRKRWNEREPRTEIPNGLRRMDVWPSGDADAGLKAEWRDARGVGEDEIARAHVEAGIAAEGSVAADDGDARLVRPSPRLMNEETATFQNCEP